MRLQLRNTRSVCRVLRVPGVDFFEHTGPVQLNSQEDRLGVLRSEIADLQAKRTAMDADFQSRLEALNLDETV